MNKIYTYLTTSSTSRRPHKGFGAAIALILLSLTTVGLALSILGAATVFADMVYRHEIRIQHGMNEKACAQSALLIKAKDAFASGPVYLKDFDCTVSL